MMPATVTTLTCAWCGPRFVWSGVPIPRRELPDGTKYCGGFDPARFRKACKPAQ